MFFVLAYWYITYPRYSYIAIESTKGVGIFRILWDFSQKNIRPPTARAKCGQYKCHTKQYCKTSLLLLLLILHEIH